MDELLEIFICQVLLIYLFDFSSLAMSSVGLSLFPNETLVL